MNILVYLIPIALLLGFSGLAVFLWAIRSGQFEDLDGAAVRILDDELEQRPIGESPRTSKPLDPSKPSGRSKSPGRSKSKDIGNPNRQNSANRH